MSEHNIPPQVLKDAQTYARQFGGAVVMYSPVFGEHYVKAKDDNDIEWYPVASVNGFGVVDLLGAKAEEVSGE